MVALRAQKESTEPRFAEAQAARADAQAAWTVPNDRLKSLEILRAWNSAGEAERASDRFDHLRRQIDKYWPPGEPRPSEHQIPALILAAREAVAAAQPKWMAACEAWEHARSVETSRIAKAMQPRQRAAVQRIAKAVTELSKAMDAERALHAELAETAPNPTSVFLPNCSPNLTGVEVYGGPLWEWRKRVRKLGLLD